MSDRKVKVGVIGLGMGIGHVQNYKQLPNAEVTAICDISEPWVNYCQKEYGVPQAFTRYQDMLAQADIEAVSVCLPVYLHMPATLAALEAGKHVLVEKPMATNVEEATCMADLAKAKGLALMVSYNQRFGQDVMYLKRYAQEGHLGDIYCARAVWRRPLGYLPAPVVERPTGPYNHNWFNEASKGGGVGRDLGAHVIDIALWVMGFPEVLDVCGRAYTHFGPAFAHAQGATFDVDDHTVGFVRFKNGASLQVEISFGQHIDQEQIVNEFFGTRGGASRGTGGVKLYGEAAGAYTVAQPRFTAPAGTTQAHFVDSIVRGVEPIVTAEQGIAVTRIIDGIYRSSQALAA